MLISELGEKLGFHALQKVFADGAIGGGFTSDLLSDVMGKATAGDVLITIQAHRNSVAVAALAGIKAIVVCSNRPVPEDMLGAARDEGIAIFTSPENQFTVSGLVWDALKA